MKPSPALFVATLVVLAILTAGLTIAVVTQFAPPFAISGALALSALLAVLIRRPNLWRR